MNRSPRLPAFALDPAFADLDLTQPAGFAEALRRDAADHPQPSLGLATAAARRSTYTRQRDGAAIALRASGGRNGAARTALGIAERWLAADAAAQDRAAAASCQAGLDRFSAVLDACEAGLAADKAAL